MKQIFLIIASLVLLALPCQAAKKKTSKVNAAELIEQAREAYLDYNPARAAELLGKVPAAQVPDTLQGRIERMDAMLQRVDAIEVIDSLTVPREEFFAHYRLSPASGSILPSDLLEGATAYLTESGSTLITSTDQGLAQSHRLTDGTWDTPTPLALSQSSALTHFPFLLQDGITLYYATEDEDGLGGLDIYVSRRNGDSFAAAQNLGLPYNSPYDDFLLAIDEETGAGWWATDRNSPGGDVTIYIYVPSDVRHNVDITDPALALRARYGSKGSNPDLLSTINYQLSTSTGSDEEDFLFILPSGRRLTNWEDFTSPQARRLMENLVDLQDELEQDRNNLEALRVDYSRGNKAVKADILRLEKKLRTAPAQVKSLSNKIIQLELK